MRLGPPPEVPEVPGPVLEGLHPRHGAGVPEADDRAAERVHPADLAGARRRREVRGPRLARDLRRARAGRDRRGQRRRVPGAAAPRPAVGPDRLLQPGRAEGPGRAAPSSPATRPTIGPGGPRSGRSTAAATRACGRTSTRSAASTAPRACPTDGGPEFIHESPCLNLYLYPAEVDYPRARPLAPTWHRLESCVRATDATWELPETLARPPGRAHLPQPRLPRVGRRRADAPADRRARPEPPPVHRLEGPAARRVRAGRQHGGGRVPAPAVDPAASSTWSSPTAGTTPSPSASTTASRWSCCRSSGTSTTTRSGSTRPVSGCRLRRIRSARRRCAAIDRAARRRRAAGAAGGHLARLKANPGTVRAADLIERVARTGEPIVGG